MKVEYTYRFVKALQLKKRRARRHADAVQETVARILLDPENRGLNTHLLDRERRIWETYVSAAIRLTFARDGDTIIFRNNCRHDIIDRRQW